MPILLNKTIRLFLDSIGKREEYQFYLQRFHAAGNSTFALIVPERMGFEDVANVFTFDLQFLLRVEIFPAILLCGKNAREMEGILDRTEDVFSRLDLSGRILDKANLDEVQDFLADCRKKSRVGVLTATGRTKAEMLAGLLPSVTKRLHFIRLRGPLHTRDNIPLPYYYIRKPDQSDLAEADLPLAGLSAQLLQLFPDLHISIASPWNLLQELFTVKGAGCLVRQGSIINAFEGSDSLDVERIQQLMEKSFGRRMKPEAIRRVSRGYVEENYRGAALLEQKEPGWYLSKFAVETEARGQGLAGEIWRELNRNDPSLFWRARSKNPINHWYRKHSDGYHESGEWTVFWRNIDWRDIPEIIEYSLNRPDDFCSV